MLCVEEYDGVEFFTCVYAIETTIPFCLVYLGSEETWSCKTSFQELEGAGLFWKTHLIPELVCICEQINI